ncbi:transmembrane protein [Citrus sinensis]|uniref:Transmembrane protein n=1 Tax=Citrus sinensis TaxID=2711 RepID=A0ACB8N9R6_CITSI|nr:transmembrane protein [Citrus sinensis]
MKMAFLTGKASFFVLVLVLVSLRSISALSQDGSDRDALKLILGEHNLGPLKNGINEDAVAPGPEMLEPLLLASNRTKRPDILNHFRRYQGGWDITNKHYWASVGFTGAAAFILAVIWFISFGLVLVAHHCCGWRINIKGKESVSSQRICLILLIVFTCAAAIGCILLSVGQDEFHGEAMHTLKYVVNQSDYTVKTLRNVTEYLSLAKTINVAQVFLPSAVMDDIDKLNRDLSTAANTLADKTSENSAKIRKVFNAVRSALITVAALMLLLSIIGLFLSILRHKHAIHIAISDTCMAMDEWVDHPHAETALSNILPCVDQRTTNKSLIQSKEVITDIVNVVNQFVYNIANANPSQDYIYYYNQTGPVMPPLCYPYDSQLQDRQCGSYEVSIANASEVWQNYSCELSTSGSSAFGQCNSVGRVTPYFYKELVSAVTEIYALQLYTPRLLSLQDCNFVRDTFQNITSNYCPPLEHYLKIVNAGLGMISVGVLLCLLLWILYANRPQREEVFVNLPLPIKCISRSQKNSVNSSNGNHVATPNTLNEV